MDNSWQALGFGHGNDGYGENYSDRYHIYNYGGGYGFLGADDNGRYEASGTGDPLTYDREYAKGFVTQGYGQDYSQGAGCGSGQAYGYSYDAYGQGNGRGDYEESGYGCVSKDDGYEDGHGNGGIYEFEDIYCYYTHNDFNAYGEYD